VTHTPTQAPVQASAPDIAWRVGVILAALAALVATRWRDPQFQPLILPLWTWLGRASRRFTRLMTRVATGRHKPRPSRPHRPTMRKARPPALPTGHAWLVRAIPYHAVAYASQLEFVLAQPGVADLLAGCPQAGRILRPLGRMLGIDSLAPKRRRAPRRRPPPPPTAAPAQPQIKPPQPFAQHPPNAAWPHTPSANWASAVRRCRTIEPKSQSA
jgi:hypothetical protein